MKDLPLTPGQRALIKAQLEIRQHELDRRLRAHHGGLSRVEHAREMLTQDDDDAPQRVGEREVDMALTDLETRELETVSQALRRVDEEDFGLCRGCGGQIPFDRLKVEPQTLHCVPCAASRESGRAQTRPK